MAVGVRVLVMIVAVLTLLWGIAVVALAVIDGYMVTVGGVPPGEPMYLDELAYPLRDAIFQGLLGAGAITLGFVAKAYARRHRRADS